MTYVASLTSLSRSGFQLPLVHVDVGLLRHQQGPEEERGGFSRLVKVSAAGLVRVAFPVWR